jgi:serine acetyltransferase
MLRQVVNRLFQVLALYGPGATSFRVWLHRRRGVRIGDGAFIGTGVILETEYPQLVQIGNNVTISIRAVVIGHFLDVANDRLARGEPSVVIEDEAYIGPNSVILHNVRIGRGSVVAAGSVVNKDVPPGVLVQGNPAKPIARCRVPLLESCPYRKFVAGLAPLREDTRDDTRDDTGKDARDDAHVNARGNLRDQA